MWLNIKRPIIWVTIAYTVGILGASYIRWKIEYFYISLIILILMAIFWTLAKLKWKGLLFLFLLSSFALAGVVNTYMSSIPNQDLDKFVGQALIIKGQVLELARQENNKTSFILKLDRIEHDNKKHLVHNKLRTTIYLNPENDNLSPINIGDWIEINGEIEKPQGLRNPKGFDYRAYLARRDIHYIIGTSEKSIISIKAGRFPWPKSWIISARESIAGVYDKYLGPEESNLIKAMILGEKWGLPSELKDHFSKTGIAHILAISGLHIGFVVLLLNSLTKSLTLSPKATFIIQALALGFYCILVGGHASIIRAVIMSIIILGGRVIGRKTDPLNSLCLAAFIILLLNPLQLFEVGFQLSFGAVIGIILFNKPISSKLSMIPGNMGGSIAVMVAAQLGTWPIIAYYFNVFSPISFLANFILVPIAGLIVMLGLIFLLLATIFPILGVILGWWLGALCNILIYGNRWLSGWSWASLSVVSPGKLFMAIYYLVLLMLSEERPSYIRRPWELSGALVIIVLLSIVFKPILNNDLMIVFVDVGQGDCIYIKTPDDKHILVDGGGRPIGMGDFDVGAEIVVPFLLKNGIGKLDLVVMSHGHDDHIGGLIPVLENLKVEAFMEFPPREITDKYKDLKGLVDNKGMESIQVVGGQTYRAGKDVLLDILYPVSDSRILDSLYNDNENNLSLVMRIRYKDTSIMLTGDIEKGVEDYLNGVWKETISVLKVAHHGSKTSSTQEWIDIINPDIAVIQSGKNNFGHPNPLVLERLEGQGAEVFRNDLGGAVTCRYRGGQWYINTIIME
ncbi:MAG TPA: DNA internalization-related competence protein ComEC/Rec2 [Clostridia bacterium]|nr:DNA internalization-related competence protein ComEC/Rec2 [Clostridia bacterium]